MTETQTAARQAYNARVAELRAQGMRLAEAHATAHREAHADELAVWRALDPRAQ